MELIPPLLLFYGTNGACLGMLLAMHIFSHKLWNSKESSYHFLLISYNTIHLNAQVKMIQYSQLENKKKIDI